MSMELKEKVFTENVENTATQEVKETVYNPLKS